MRKNEEKYYFVLNYSIIDKPFKIIYDLTIYVSGDSYMNAKLFR